MFNPTASTVTFTTASADNTALTLTPNNGAVGALTGTGAANFEWDNATHTLKLKTLPAAAATATLTFTLAGVPDKVVTISAPAKP